jgi:nucleoside-triphosphatase THEP1
MVHYLLEPKVVFLRYKGGFMTIEKFIFTENLLNLGAVIYGPGEDANALLASFATRLQNQGRRLGGVIQYNRDGCGPAALMAMTDLMTSETISICQNLGQGSASCKLDPAGLANAAQAVRRAITDNVDLVIVNKFGKSEAGGRGMRAEIADAIVAGLPVLTAVSQRIYDAWQDFTSGFGTTLLCDEAIVEDWWGEISRKLDCRRRVGTEMMLHTA